MFLIERPEDAERVREYLANRHNAVLVVLAKGVRKKDLVRPRIPRRKFVRVIRIDELEELMTSGAMLPSHWKKKE